MRVYKNKTRFCSQSASGQTMIEFTFSMIVVLIMMFALMKVFEWTGKDQAMRRIAHDDRLFSPISGGYSRGDPGQGPLKQIDPYFYTPISFNAIWDGK